MSLAKVKVEREHLHTRQVICEGYKRSDGLWDLEACLIDTKTYAFANLDRGGQIAAEEPLHNLRVRLTLDLDFLIHAVDVEVIDTPYHVCKQSAEPMQSLVGLRIKSGWIREVKARVGSKTSCTHLVELLRPLATTAYQTMGKDLMIRHQQQSSKNKPRILNTCIAHASDSPVVAREWPEYYTGKNENDD